MTRQDPVSYKDLHLGRDRLKIGFWSRRRANSQGKSEAFEALCRKNSSKAFDNPIRHAHNSISSLLTQRRDERHSLPISV